MHHVIQKSFGGLPKGYYIRHVLFCSVFSALMCALIGMSKAPLAIPMFALVITNTLLYPYVRFVYDSIVNFILGDKVYYVPVILVLIVKAFILANGMAFAIFIAPFGLLYLYFRKACKPTPPKIP